MSCPEVSVIIPSYNMGELVTDAIDSVVECELDSVEIIVVDDGSSDGTKNIVKNYINNVSKKYKNKIKYLYQKNRGKKCALNKGLKASEGKYFAILDADDEITNNSLKSRLDKAKLCKSEVDCVIGGFEVIDEFGRVVGERRAPKNQNPSSLKSKYFMHYKTPFHLCACLLNKRIVEKVGFFDEYIERVEDIDYALRILDDRNKIKTVDVNVYRYRKYRNKIIKRLKYRWKTLVNRPKVYWKNYEGIKAPVSVTLGVVYDTAKVLYETVIGNYFG
jgi:glycosyltransferase involved in cell wall biosynthesis